MSTTARHRVDWTFVIATVRRALLPIWFALFGLLVAGNVVEHGYLFIDVVIYREAAATALAGGDPWAAGSTGLAFAGPPPSLLLAIPLAFLPLEVAIVVTTAVLVGAAVWAIRRLRLPLWWLLFPPIVESLLVGNLDVLVLALLLLDGPAAGLAAVAKVYGAIPLLFQRRWSALLVAAGAAVLTLPLWPSFIANIAGIGDRLDAQSGGFSAWGTLWMVPTVVALWLLRRRGAEWLVVPGLWPNTQTHYAAMSLVAVHRYPLAAAIIGLQSPFAPVLAILLMAIQVRFDVGPRNAEQTP